MITPATATVAAEMDRPALVLVADEAPITRAEARRITEGIKAGDRERWETLLRFYERDGHLALGYDAFGSYFEAEFAKDGSYGWRELAAARVVRVLRESPIGDWPLPANESVARHLVALENRPDKLRDIWAHAVEMYGQRPKAREVAEVVERHHRMEIPCQWCGATPTAVVMTSRDGKSGPADACEQHATMVAGAQVNAQAMAQHWVEHGETRGPLREAPRGVRPRPYRKGVAEATPADTATADARIGSHEVRRLLADWLSDLPRLVMRDVGDLTADEDDAQWLERNRGLMAQEVEAYVDRWIRDLREDPCEPGEKAS